MADDLRLVGLDLGTRAAGIAWTHDRTGAPAIGCTTVHTDGLPLHTRIHRVLEDVEVVTRCRPHLVVVEGTFSRLSGSDVPLHMLRGVILHWLWSRRPSIRYIDVSPSTLKVWAAGKGDAPKRRTVGPDGIEREGVVEAVTAAYGHLVHIGSSDEADAVGLLSFAAAAYGEPIAAVPDYARRAFELPKAPRWPGLSTEAGPVVPVVPAAGVAVSGGAADRRRPTRARAGAR